MIMNINDIQWKSYKSENANSHYVVSPLCLKSSINLWSFFIELFYGAGSTYKIYVVSRGKFMSVINREQCWMKRRWYIKMLFSHLSLRSEVNHGKSHSSGCESKLRPEIYAAKLHDYRLSVTHT
jgi:hypothetical protein